MLGTLDLACRLRIRLSCHVDVEGGNFLLEHGHALSAPVQIVKPVFFWRASSKACPDLGILLALSWELSLTCSPFYLWSHPRTPPFASCYGAPWPQLSDRRSAYKRLTTQRVQRTCSQHGFKGKPIIPGQKKAQKLSIYFRTEWCVVAVKSIDN